MTARWALLSGGIAGGFLLAAHLLRRYMKASTPQVTGEERLPGLEHPVEVIRDSWGVPHIYARTERDLFFAQGFVHAQERLFQMDVYRRLGLGRLSEIAGPLTLATDRLARILDWPRVAQAVISGLADDNETNALVSAYVTGVNSFIAQNKLPPAFRLLAYQPEPWQARDCAAWGAVLAWGLSVNWETELLRARLVDVLGPERAADLTPGYGSDYPTILPSGTMNGRLARELGKAYREVARYLPLGATRAGSNNWVVSGQWTVGGHPLLANDPHLPPLFPAIWYENHLEGGRFRVTGFTIPGVPGVTIGHNARIAWGVTNAFPDIQDLYVETFHPTDPTRYKVGDEWRRAEVVREEIRVRGRREPVVEQIRFTRHGPVISDLVKEMPGEVALRWTAYESNNHFRTILAMNRADDWQEFRDALRDWAFPPQNVVFADVDGNIGYMMPGRVPLRREGAGLMPVRGDNDSGEWQSRLPFDELPQLYNPPAGMIITANNRVTDDAYPHLLTGEWLPPYRAERIRSLLIARAPVTLTACAEIQNDVVSLMARRFLRSALPALRAAPLADDPQTEQAIILLRHWHKPPAGEGDQMDAQLVAPSLCFAWLSAFTRACMTQAVGPLLTAELLSPPATPELPAGPFHEIALELAVTWLERGAPDWVGAVHPLLHSSLRSALVKLQQHAGHNLSSWQWGRLHHIHFQHPLTRVPALGRLWRPLKIPVGGDGFTVNQTESIAAIPPGPVKVIAGCRLLMDLSDWDASRSALAGGQSGHPASKHYQDGLAEWRRGRYHPMLFSRQRVEEAAADTLRLIPLSD